MKISARIENTRVGQRTTVATEGREESILIPPKLDGLGSSINGGELLFLALATCYCNDLHREAQKRSIAVESVHVEVNGEFGAEGEGARNITYRAHVSAEAPQDQILELMRYTDSVTEIQNTLRSGTPVLLFACDATDVS